MSAKARHISTIPKTPVCKTPVKGIPGGPEAALRPGGCRRRGGGDNNNDNDKDNDKTHYNNTNTSTDHD